MNNFEFNLQQRISDRIAFPIILIVGFIIALITISIGEKILSGFPNSEVIIQTKNYSAPDQLPEVPFVPLEK